MLCVSIGMAQSAVPNVPAKGADDHLVNRVEPSTPPLAKTLKVGGTVKLQLTVSQTGEVVAVKTLSGHPMLVGAATEAAKKWKYRPFNVDGQPARMTTNVEISFAGGMSEDESAVRNKFFPLEDECRTLVNKGEYAAAEAKCREAVELSNRLPKDVILERSSARSLLANTIYLQRRYAEAIPIYEDALHLDQGYLKPDDADLASDYWNLGRAYGMVGQIAKADGLYATAVSTFEAAIKSLPDMKENYTRRLKRCLTEYGQLKEAQGQSDAAAALRKKASGL
jgi:TonB family protein